MIRCWQVASSPPPFSSKTRPSSSYPPHPAPTLGRRGGFCCGLLVVDFPRGHITSRRVPRAYWLATKTNNHFKVGNLPTTSIISNTRLLPWRFERHPVSLIPVQPQNMLVHIVTAWRSTSYHFRSSGMGPRNYHPLFPPIAQRQDIGFFRFSWHPGPPLTSRGSCSTSCPLWSPSLPLFINCFTGKQPNRAETRISPVDERQPRFLPWLLLPE